MWTLTNFGAFSTTLRDAKDVKNGDERLLQVRARRAKHLRELKNRYMPSAGEVVRLRHRDYEFRIYCTHDDWALAVARMAQDINYGNFKDSVEDHDLHRAYMRVWSALYDALATNKFITHYKGRKGRKHVTSTVSASRTDAWAGWEDVDYAPSTYDTEEDVISQLEDKYPNLNWR
jgi:hypothetical protein